MPIVEKYYNNDRALNIREIITQNFDNVAKYIPNNFIVLTTTERQNLPDDWKTHFKLVFDKEYQRVFRWSEIQRRWEQYLIYAWDDYARREANTNSEQSFAEVQLGIDESGVADPYTFTFYNRDYDEVNGATGETTFHPKSAKGSVTLQALNIKFNNEHSVQTIIQQLLDDLSSLDNFVGNRDDILNNSDLTATTVCGAIKEVNTKTIENKTRLDNIMSGVTKVPEAIHAEHADLADIATLARDSEKLGGQLPSYYATASDLNDTDTLLDATIDRVAANESNIYTLQNNLNTTNSNLQALDNREAGHYTEYSRTRDLVNTHSVQIGDIEDSIELLNARIGWQILT